MIKKLIVGFSLLATVVAPGLVRGEEMDGTVSTKVEVESSTEVKAPRDSASGQATGKRQYAPVKIIKEVGREVRAEVKDVRADVRTEIKDLRSATKEEMEAMRARARGELDAKREALKKEVEAKRETLKTQVETKREQLKERLKVVRDEKKKETVEKLDRRLDEINQNRTDHYLNVLEKLNEAVERIVSRTDKAAARGLDVTSVRTAIDAAKAAIASAEAVAKAQAGKTYTISVTTEVELRAAVKAAHDALKEDLRKVHEAVKAAHDAVRKAAVALAQIPRVDDDTATTTPSNS